jgi:alkylhydroperoxidase family enzyme
MTEEMVVAMLDHRNSSLDERTRVALDLAEDFILNHARSVDDAFMDRLKQHFSEAQIVELTIAIGIWDSVHKFNNVFDVDPPVEEGTFQVNLPDVPEDMRDHVSHPGNKY